MARDPCCDTISGGRISISVGDHAGNGNLVFEGRGDCEIEPRTEEREADATNSGAMYSTVKAKLAMCRIPYANLCDRDPLDLFDLKCKVNVTIVEEDRGFRHLFANSVITGTPTVNLSTGEVTGLEVKTAKYKRTVQN